MFNKEKSNSTEKFASNSATLISAGTVLKGDVQSDNDLRIDGTIHGNVTSTAKIVVGPTGFVEGNIQGSQADVTGKVIGNINVKELAQLRSKSIVQGNISAVNLQIEAGAAFNGQSIMTINTNVVQMNEGEVLHAKAK
ncbi:MAG TPA: polymer-forming cytoskeletal protein [Flavisolibacter sp.]|jgi:cytoskeletal protein CcmA (bactofilin family)|nr:polymer-forming cytoskeletal protein [Flavisolibacter sp.]